MKLDEATPKSTRERIFRHLRPNKKTTAKSRKSVVPHLPGMVVPKKTGNNDPHRGGNKLHNEYHDVVEFLAENSEKHGEQLKTVVNQFKDKQLLSKFVHHLIAVGMGGWSEIGGKFINESGNEASKDNWVLNGDRLAPVGRRMVRYQLDWLHELREHCYGRENT